MAAKRRKFKRSYGEVSYRRRFIIAAEGVKTEKIYFEGLEDSVSVDVDFLKGKNQSSPLDVLKRMQDRLKEETMKSSDEAWLVVDKDNWTDQQLYELYQWSLLQENYGFALSNPKFEYWLLLHYENGKDIGSSKECDNRLNRVLPNYNKGIDMRKISRQQIEEAINRARSRDQPPCQDWPRDIGQTTVYRLVERIINSAQ